METEPIKVSEVLKKLKRAPTMDFMEKELATISMIRDLRVALEKVDEDFIDEISKGEIFFGRAFRGNEAYDILLHLENILESRIEETVLKLN